jgi:hypothetical protein
MAFDVTGSTSMQFGTKSKIGTLGRRLCKNSRLASVSTHVFSTHCREREASGQLARETAFLNRELARWRFAFPPMREPRLWRDVHDVYEVPSWKRNAERLHSNRGCPAQAYAFMLTDAGGGTGQKGSKKSECGGRSE